MTSASQAPGRRYVFLDEAGNFDFSRKRGASRYFVLTSVTRDDCSIGNELLALRRQLAWDGALVSGTFHATEDLQAVRDEVFRIIGRHELQIDATIIEKSKAQPHLTADHGRFFKMTLYQHLKFVAGRVAPDGGEVMVVCSALGTRGEQEAHVAGLQDVLRQVLPLATARHGMWPTVSDPCLQIADYCCWAIQRRLEHTLPDGRPDTRSYDLLKRQISSEFELFRLGTEYYY